MSFTPSPSAKRSQGLRRVSLLTRGVAAASIGLTGVFAYLAAVAHPATHKAAAPANTNASNESNTSNASRVSSSSDDDSVSSSSDDDRGSTSPATKKTTTPTTETPIQTSPVFGSSHSSASISSGQS